MNHSLQCKCGTVRGQLSHIEKSTRIMCYCKDCQAFAHFLGHAGDILDPQGGSDVLVSQPDQLTFTSGAQALACISLSEQGMLRWYASCCNTPIGNTSRNNKLAFVGLARGCLAERASADAAFGPVRMHSCTESAKGKVASSTLGALPVMAGFGVKLLRARLSGSYLRNPFFKPGGAEPVVPPKVLDKQESARLRAL